MSYAHQQVKPSWNYHNNNERHEKSHSIKPIELEVNISIGKNKFLLQVEKCSNLHQQVQLFLKDNHINLKYEGPILKMVREELAKKNLQQQSKQGDESKFQIQQLKQIKSEMESKRKMLEKYQQNEQIEHKRQDCELWKQKQHKAIKKSVINLCRQNKQNYSSQYNSNSRHGSSTEAPQSHVQLIKQPLAQMNQQQIKSQNIYQKWKIKQKVKQTQKVKNSAVPGNKKQKDKQKSFVNNKSFVKQKQQQKQAASKSKSHKKLQVHSPDFFYNKGMKFKQAKQDHIKHMYKQKYPFQLNREASLTPTKKRELHERLFRQHKIKQSAILQTKIQEIRAVQKQKNTPQVIDKYKQKVIERDSKLNQALHYLIENKMIENPYKIEKVSKSPFRKTNC